MSENNGFITTQKKLSVNIDEDFKKLFNRVADYLGLDEDNYGITDVIQTTFKRIDEKFKPVINKESELKSKIEALTKELTETKEFSGKVEKELQYYAEENKKLSDNIGKLQEDNTVLSDKIKEYEANGEQSNEKFAELLNQKAVLEQKLQDAVSKLHGKVELNENQVILELTDVQKAYLLEIIKQRKFAEFLKEANKKGKFDTIIKPLIADSEEDTGRALLGWFFYSAKLNKYPLIPFDKWIKTKKKKDE